MDITMIDDEGGDDDEKKEKSIIEKSDVLDIMA